MGAHGLATLAAIVNDLAVAIKLAIVVAVVLNYRFSARTLQQAPTKIRYSDSQNWQIVLNGEYETVQILPDTVLTTLAIFLSFKQGKQRHHWLIAKDALSEADYRKLLVKLKTTQAR